MEHKKQHWIPRSYLAAWCDPSTPEHHTPYVWQFTKDGKSRKRKAPKNIFHEKDLYTIPLSDGSRELALEHGLAGLEGEFVRIRDTVLAASRCLSEKDQLLLCAYIGAMHARGVPHLDHWKNQFRKAIDLGDRLKRTVEALSPEERAEAARKHPPPLGDPRSSISHEDFKRAVEGPVAPWVASMIRIQLPWLTRMQLQVLTTDDDVGFITSDQPCVWFDPVAHLRPWPLQSPGLATKTIEITFPVSPDQLVLLTHNAGTPGYYLPIPQRIVDELNRRTRFLASRHFIVNRDSTKERWFEVARRHPPKEDTFGESLP